MYVLFTVDRLILILADKQIWYSTYLITGSRNQDMKKVILFG